MYSNHPYENNEMYEGMHTYNYPLNEQNFYPETEQARQILPWLPSFGGGSTTDPGSPPAFPPPGQGSQAGPPMGPPPEFTPSQKKQAQTLAIDPGSIQGCLYRYTYVWLRGFQQFWFYPTYVGRRSVSGYRWNGFRWTYFGIDLRQIQSFTCF